MKVAIICAQGLEECEGLLVYDLLFRAKLDVDLIGLDSEDITSSHGVTFKTNKLLKDVDIKEYDCLVLPGGVPGRDNLENSKLVQDAIDYFISSNKLLAALCSAPSLLIKKGLLNDNEFTCFPGWECGKQKIHVKAYQIKNIITGNGLGGTIEFAQMIIKNLVDEETANDVLKRIQYID